MTPAQSILATDPLPNQALLQALKIVGDSWSILIVKVLLTSSARFNQLKDQVPDITNTMLSSRLKYLQIKGILNRRVLNTSPVAVEYNLTPLGRGLEPIITSIQDFADRYLD